MLHGTRRSRLLPGPTRVGTARRGSSRRGWLRASIVAGVIALSGLPMVVPAATGATTAGASGATKTAATQTAGGATSASAVGLSTSADTLAGGVGIGSPLERLAARLNRPAPAAASPRTAAAIVRPEQVAAAVGVAAGAVSGFVPIDVIRVLDTRQSTPIGPNSSITVPVVDFLRQPASAVAGVSLNITVDSPPAAGYLTVWPGSARPVASTLNFVPGQVVPNGVVVGVDGSTGTVSIFNGSASPAQVIVDLSGWVPLNAGFTPIAPVRALETRPGAAGFAGTTRLQAGQTTRVNLASFLPAADRANVTAVSVNLTAVSPSGPGYLTAYPAGGAFPPTSSVNFGPGEVVPNSAVLALGVNGSVDVFDFGSATDVLIDITGYFVRDLTFRGVTPKRIVDTRQPGFQGLYNQSGSQLVQHSGPMAANSVSYLKVDELGGLPRGFVGTAALNVTAATTSAAGYLTVFPAASAVPTASTVNFAANKVSSNETLVGVDLDSYVAIYNSGGTTDVLVDLTGWFPQDALGLIADAREYRRYSIGSDPIAITSCQPSSGAQIIPAQDATSRMQTGARAYYQWLSGAAYAPTFVSAGDGMAQPVAGGGLAAYTCVPSAGWPANVLGGLRVIPNPLNGGYGVAGPGNTCLGVACSLAESTFTGSNNAATDNSRDGTITANSFTNYFSIPVHEMGHMLGWPHSFSGRGDPASATYQYDNPLDIMSEKPGSSPNDTQATIALNRYAAGWIDPSLVAKHVGTSATYTLVGKGGGPRNPGGKELLVIPTSDPAAYVVADVRVKIAPWDTTMGGFDSKLGAEGVELYKIDQRASAACPSTLSPYFNDRCSGLERRTQQAIISPTTTTPPDPYAHVLRSGNSVTIGGVTIAVASTGTAGVYTVTVTGATADFGTITW